MQMAPRALYEEYTEARKQPYIIHFAGYQKPWNVVDCDFAYYFWKYAKLSPYFPILLRTVIRGSLEEPSVRPADIENNPTIRRLANKILPFGSRRREALKKIYKKLRK